MRNPFKRRQGRHSVQRAPLLFRSVAERRHRFAFLKKKSVLITLAIVLVVGAGGGYGAYFYFRLQRHLQDPGVKTDAPPASDEDTAFNVLLVGSDSRKGLTEKEQFDLGAEEVPGERADTLIVARIDPDVD